jgi:hypothetical protein
MAKKQAAQAPAPAPAAPAPTIVNAAPGYDPYARPPGSPAPSGITAPGGPYAPPQDGQAYITPPPPRADQKDFINADFLWKFGRPVKAVIQGVRDATGTGREFPGQTKRVKRAWFLDFKFETHHPVTQDDEATGRINEGDTRHQRLWTAYQDKWVGKTVILRLTNPGDIDSMTGKASKALWMLDCQ